MSRAVSDRVRALRSLETVLSAPSLKTVFDALEGAGFEARLVGGCVRDGLMGRRITDVDIATTALPNSVLAIADAHTDLHAYPTGLAHGTITLRTGTLRTGDQQFPDAFEVTTLRRDAHTDGRRAVVEFTTDWAEDARRRDFTINALYCDRSGEIFDPTGRGRADLDAKRVCYIGDPVERIREDYLRILRFYRFSGRFAEGPFDRDGLNAIQAEREGLKQLSAERVRDELLKILTSRRRLRDVLQSMIECGVLRVVFGDCDWAERSAQLERYIQMEACDIPKTSLTDGMSNGVDALGFIGGATQETVADFAKAFRLSNHDASCLAALIGLAHSGVFRRDADECAFRKAVDQHGAGHSSQLLQLAGRWAWAISGDPIDCQWRQDQLWLLDRMTFPQLPISGKDVVALGVPAGPDIGIVLHRLHGWWIDENCPTDRVLLENKLTELAGPYIAKS
ncbi:MAG: CCA tRNA nucleotidyltransferase [Pseudomonadota bacterium]